MVVTIIPSSYRLLDNITAINVKYFKWIILIIEFIGVIWGEAKVLF